MRVLFLVAALLLGGCASPVPKADPQQAWIELYAPAGELLMAERLDRQRWPDGRYFQVTPGAHELLVHLQFEANRGGMGMGLDSEPLLLTCELRLRYDSFAAGQRYRVEARAMAMSAQAWLYDGQRKLLARGQVMRCGTAF